MITLSKKATARNNRNANESAKLLLETFLGRVLHNSKFQNIEKWPLVPFKELLGDEKGIIFPPLYHGLKPENSRRLGKPSKSSEMDLFLNQGVN